MTRHTIEAGEKPLLDIFCDKYLFSIPSYQRPYAWTTEQTGELLSDISDACGERGDVDDQSPYFLGSIVLIKDPVKPSAEVVDGQQRLTTLTILLSVLRDLAPPEIGTAIHKYVCQVGNPIENTQDVFRISPRARDADFFRDKIQASGATANLPEFRNLPDSRARMVENASYLRDHLKDLSDQERNRLASYIARRCYLVVVAASDQESAFRIFSILNSRGLDLSPADIFKADVIGGVPDALQDKYTQTWEDIEDELGRERFGELFAHIRMIHRKQKMAGNLIAEFREFVPNARTKATKFVDDELGPYAETYREITDLDFSSFKNAEEINYRLKQLSRLDNTDWQPPAISAITRSKSDPDFVLQFLTELDRLAHGLFLMRSDPNERLRRYGRLLSSIEQGDDLFEAKSPLQLDKNECKLICDALAGDIYLSTRTRLPILLRVDELLSSGGAVYDHKTTTVEHVLPQTPPPNSRWSKDFPTPESRLIWVHKLANLVLLTQRKNSQAGNLDFVDKRDKYFASKKGVTPYALTSQVRAENEWTSETLKRRQAELLALLYAHWRLA